VHSPPCAFTFFTSTYTITRHHLPSTITTTSTPFSPSPSLSPSTIFPPSPLHHHHHQYHHHHHHTITITTTTTTITITTPPPPPQHDMNRRLRGRGIRRRRRHRQHLTGLGFKPQIRKKYPILSAAPGVPAGFDAFPTADCADRSDAKRGRLIQNPMPWWGCILFTSFLFSPFFCVLLCYCFIS
jgi:hypothetical protein